MKAWKLLRANRASAVIEGENAIFYNKGVKTEAKLTFKEIAQSYDRYRTSRLRKIRDRKSPLFAFRTLGDVAKFFFWGEPVDIKRRINDGGYFKLVRCDVEPVRSPLEYAFFKGRVAHFLDKRLLLCKSITCLE